MRTTIRSTTRAARCLSAALAVANALAGTLALAAPASPTSEDNEARAEARFREGSAAFDAGRVDEACTALDASLRLFPTLGTLLNLALCHEKQGKTASAWLEFTYAAAWSNDPAGRDRREFAHQHALRLERGLARVQIELPPDAQTHLEIDGQPVDDARQALPVFLDPGPHVIAVSASGRERYESTVAVAAASPSETLVVKIPPLKEDATDPAALAWPTGAHGRSPSGRRTAGWILGGVGITSLGAAVYFGADSFSKLSTLAARCTHGCDSGQAKASETFSLLTLGTGLAALVAGAWLSLSPPPPPVSSAARVSIVARVSARSGVVGVLGVW